jgi:hypothetical protein
MTASFLPSSSAATTDVIGHNAEPAKKASSVEDARILADKSFMVQKKMTMAQGWKKRAHGIAWSDRQDATSLRHFFLACGSFHSQAGLGY